MGDLELLEEPEDTSILSQEIETTPPPESTYIDPELVTSREPESLMSQEPVQNMSTEPESSSFVSEERPKDSSLMFEADAYAILESASDADTGYNELVKAYYAKDWDDQEAALSTLESFGKKLRQKLKISTIPSNDIYDWAPIKPDDILSEEVDDFDNRIDRVKQWKEKNLEFLDSTNDPDYIASKDLLKRSIIKHATELEGKARGEARDTSFLGLPKIKDYTLRAVRGLVDPLYGAVTGEDFKVLDPLIDPKRDENFLSKAAEVTGGVVGTVGGAVLGAGAALTAATSAPISAGTAIAIGGFTGMLPTAIGAVKQRFNLIEEETGSTENALKSAGIEAASQAVQLFPLGRLTGAAAKGIERGLLKEGEQALLESAPTLGSSVMGSAIRGAAEETTGEVAGMLLSNQSLRVGLETNDINLLDGLGDTLIFGSLFGAGFGAFGGIKEGSLRRELNKASNEDTALMGIEKAEKGKTADTERLTKGIAEEDLPPITTESLDPETLQELFPDVETNVFSNNPNDTDSTTFVKEGSLYRNTSNTNVQEQTPKEILNADLKEIIDSPVIDDDIVDGDFVNPDDFVGKDTVIETEDALESSPNIMTPSLPGEQQEVFISSNRGKSYEDLGYAAGAWQLNQSIFNRLLQLPGQLTDFITHVGNHIGKYGHMKGDLKNPSKSQIFVPREVFTDPIQAVKTFQHEFGHFVDLFNNWMDEKTPEELGQLFNLKPLIAKLALLKSTVANVSAQSSDTINRQAKLVSSQWRPGWDGKSNSSPYERYRDSPKEVFVDVFSALMLNPSLVKKQKDLYRFIKENIKSNPELQEFWNWFSKNQENPRIIQDIALVNKAKEYSESIKRSQKQIEEEYKQNNPSAYIKAQRMFNSIRAAIINPFYKLEQAVKTATPKVQKELFRHINAVRLRKGYLSSYLNSRLTTPFKSLMESVPLLVQNVEVIDSNGTKRLAAPKEFIVDVSKFMEDTRTLEDTSPGYERIKEDPQKYMSFVESYFLGEGPINTRKTSIAEFLPDKYKQQLRQAIKNKDADAFIDLLARFKLEVKTQAPKGWTAKDVKAFNDAKTIPHPYFSKIDERLKNLSRAIPIKNAESIVPETRQIIKDLTGDDTFNIRRYLANPGLNNSFEAQSSLNNLKAKWGQNYRLLEQFSKDFHNTMGSTFELIEQSGMFPPELIERMRLNKDSYIHHAVLKYFTSYADLGASIKSAVGSLTPIGDPIGATFAKTHAITIRAVLQTGENSLVDAARLSGFEVTQIVDVPNIKPGDLWKAKDKLQRKNKNDLYAIKMQDGKATLYKIKDGQFGLKYLLDFPSEMTAAERVLQDVSKALMIRQLRTIYRPVFPIYQKWYDTKNLVFQIATRKSLNPLEILRTMKEVKTSKEDIKEAYTTGKSSKDNIINEAIDLFITEDPLVEYGVSNKKLDNLVEIMSARYELDWKLPENGVDRAHRVGSDFLDSFILGRGIKKGAKFLTDVASQDEMRAKTTGYKLGLLLGMSKEQAAQFGRLSFGTPDPHGGGHYAPRINNMFLFGRAWLNSWRKIADAFSNSPSKLQASAAYALYGIGPTMLMTAAWASLGRALYGDETGDALEKWYEKTPSFEKYTRHLFPLGFIDHNGEMRLFGTFKNSEIQNSWKALSFGLPEEPLIADLNRFTWPFVEGILNGSIGNVGDKFVDAGASTATGAISRINPLLQLGYNTAALALGGTPYDLYRGKPVLPKELQEGGDLFQKGEFFAGYAAQQLAPPVFSFNPFQDSNKSATGLFEELASLPVGGPILRSFLRASNYGEIEQSQKYAKEDNAFRAATRLNYMGPLAQEVHGQYKSLKALSSSYRGKYKEQLTDTEEYNAKLLFSWERKWTTAMENIRNAIEKDDENTEEDVAYWANQLEEQSQYVLEQIKQNNEEATKQ